MGVSIMRLYQLLFLALVLKMGNAMMEQDQLFNSGNEKLADKLETDPSRIPIGWKEESLRIPIGWKGWERGSYLHNLFQQIPKRWNPMANNGKSMKNWYLNKSLQMLPKIPMDIEIPSKRFLLAPKLSKLYKWKLIQNLNKLEDENDMKQIIDTINDLVNANKPDLQNDRDIQRISHKRTIQTRATRPDLEVLRFG